MSTTAQVREFLRAHPGKKYNNAALREALDSDNSTAISVALNQLHTNKEISRAKGETGVGFFYWFGNLLPSAARVVNGKDTADDDDKEETPTMPASTVRAIERVLDAVEAKKKKPKKSKHAAPKQSRVPRKGKAAKAPKAKRTYTRRAPPQEQTPPPATAAVDSSTAVFAIRQDGELGIDHGGKAVSLPRAEVQRLQVFLKTVAPLWSPAQ